MSFMHNKEMKPTRNMNINKGTETARNVNLRRTMVNRSCRFDELTWEVDLWA